MKMIRIERLEKEVAQLKEQWCMGEPFPHVVIDDFLTDSAAAILNRAFPNSSQTNINMSRDVRTYFPALSRGLNDDIR